MDGFKLIEQADKPPGKCIASRDIEGPFIDTGNNITERGRVIISCRWIGEAATEFLDMIPRAEVAEAIQGLEDRLASYATRMEELQELADSRDAFIKAAKKVKA